MPRLSTCLSPATETIELLMFEIIEMFSQVNRAVVSLLNIVIETNETTACDDLAVRYRAGHLLAKVRISCH